MEAETPISLSLEGTLCFGSNGKPGDSGRISRRSSQGRSASGGDRTRLPPGNSSRVSHLFRPRCVHNTSQRTHISAGQLIPLPQLSLRDCEALLALVRTRLSAKMKIIINALCLLGIRCQVRDPFSSSKVEDTTTSAVVSQSTASNAVSASVASCNLNTTLWMNCGSPEGAMRCLLEGTTCLPDCHIHTYDHWCDEHCSCADHNTGFYAVTNPIELPPTQPNHDDVEIRVHDQPDLSYTTDISAGPSCKLSCPSDKIRTFCVGYAAAHCKQNCVLGVTGVDGPVCAAFCSCSSIDAN